MRMLPWVANLTAWPMLALALSLNAQTSSENVSEGKSPPANFSTRRTRSSRRAEEVTNPAVSDESQSAEADKKAAEADKKAKEPWKALSWRLIGPFRGGRVLAVSGVPGDPNTYYFGAVAGGCGRPRTAA